MLVQALAGKNQVLITAVWTEEGELFIFGDGEHEKLGHGGETCEPVPMLVQRYGPGQGGSLPLGMEMGSWATKQKCALPRSPHRRW